MAIVGADICDDCAIYEDNFKNKIPKYISEILGIETKKCPGLVAVAALDENDKLIIDIPDKTECKRYVNLEDLKKRIETREKMEKTLREAPTRMGFTKEEMTTKIDMPIPGDGYHREEW